MDDIDPVKPDQLLQEGDAATGFEMILIGEVGRGGPGAWAQGSFEECHPLTDPTDGVGVAFLRLGVAKENVMLVGQGVGELDRAERSALRDRMSPATIKTFKPDAAAVRSRKTARIRSSDDASLRFAVN